MSVTPCRLAGVNHALVTIASSHFSTVSDGYDTSVGFVIYGAERRALKTASGYSDELLMVAFLDAERIGRAAQ
jgi:hypothetical protein